MLPVAEILPPVNKLPPAIFAAEVILPVADINPAVNKLPPVILPVAETKPAVLTLPTLALPVTLKLGNVPTLVATTPVNNDPLPL